MLYYNTITDETLELLKKLQSVSEFSKLRLVGGTALALQLGHRQSIDIDLFGQLDCDEYTLVKRLNDIGKTVQIKKSNNINIFAINKIKVDIVNYPYPWLYPAIVDGSIILSDKPDIAAMKLSAIAGRGTKKDFIDLFYLLKEFSLSEMLGFYKQKYSDGSEFLVLRSLSYFTDAEEDEEPLMLQKVNWDFVKKAIKMALKNVS